MPMTDSTELGVDREIHVQLDPCLPHDADAVADVLRECFPADVPAPGPAAAPGHVRSFLIKDRPGDWPSALRPAALSGQVDVDLIGPADGVRHVRGLLASTFEVKDRGTVPGEHEVELRLRLG
ncbi:hypothetical protein [Streptacidiphilus rugosus]|uniref:hypothetical protein n=1 Tax=Streptacidiphilus rugosus TaxID=405783 RepID=UPI000562C6C6|nr:hypothetical protein [Streptacidiphilus rugosus]